MALKVKKTYATGLELEYWRVNRIEVDLNNQFTIYLAGYKDQEWRDNNENGFGATETFIMEADKNLLMSGNLLEAAYGKITESKPESRTVAINEDTGEDIIEDVETNEFATAERV